MHSWASFKELRAVHLYELDEAGWQGWYPAMAGYLGDADPAIRKAAVERLSLAVISVEASAELRARGEGHGWNVAEVARMAWLLDLLEKAHVQHPDILPAFIRGLHVRGEEWPPMTPLRAWLHRLAAASPENVDPDRVEAALLRLTTFDDESFEDKARLIALLDHPAAVMRACAAHALSDFARDDLTLFDLIKEKELVRPGVAGPFWSEFHMDDWNGTIDPIPWMLDILERRTGPEPSLDEMEYNGIDFYLHEVCDGSPDAVRRMIAGGHVELAVETATEIHCVMPGMEPILMELGHHADPNIAKRARMHLAMHYRVLHPAVADGTIRHWPEWDASAEVFSFHWGENLGGDDLAPWFIKMYPRIAADFSDADAWALIDRALPPVLRGEVVRHVLDMSSQPVGPYDLGDLRMIQFTSGAHLTLEGDVKTERWRRIEIGGAKLGDTWTPFDNAKPPGLGRGEL